MSHEYPAGAYPGNPEEVTEQARALLLTLSPEKRAGALAGLDICEHCGIDERDSDGLLRSRACQCWNDE